MKYKLYDNSKNDINSRSKIQDFLMNREIKNPSEYINLTDSVTYRYNLLENIDEAFTLFQKHYANGDTIGILIDSDPDGYCSAAMMYLYIKKMDSNYPVEYIMHQRAKAHGLNDDIVISKDIKLLIIPDAGTNDVEQCHDLNIDGLDILILDHHESECENPYAVIVNNQTSPKYFNKEFCGAGIVYKFLQKLDDEYWIDCADDFLDLCALANISDVMDMRSLETRYYTNLGLLNITNKCFQALIKAQDYSMNGKVNIHNIQWSITPILNGMIRVGSQEEKELLFRAFIEQDEFFEYKKRATKDNPAETIQESIYDRVARLCKNAKSRQDKTREKSLNEMKMSIGAPEDNLDKVILFDSTDIIDSSLTGVMAIKIAEYYNKPCILLNRINDDYFSGSARNFDNSPIESFKDIINKTNIFHGKGHPNACGVLDLAIKDKDAALQSLNSLLDGIEYDSVYKCDYIIDQDDISISLITDLAHTEDLIAQGIDDPMIAVKNINLSRNDFEIFGKNSDTISFKINDIKFIMFKCKEGNRLYEWIQDAWDDVDEIEFSIVGKPEINEYEGVRTPQIVIEDVEVLENNNSEDDDVEW